MAAACTLALCFSTHGAKDARAIAVSRSVTCDDASTAPALAPRRFVFPRDDGAHPGFEIESWRTFGRVSDLASNRYDVSITVSRYAVASCAVATHANRWTAANVVTTAYTVFDETTAKTTYGERVEREGPLGIRIATGKLEISGTDLSIEQRHTTVTPAFALRLRDADRASLDFIESVRKKAVALGPHGIAKTGSCETCAAYAYVYTHDDTRGTLKLAGAPRAVAGTMWFEHELAHRELDPGDAGWDRFSIAFDDGRAFDALFTRDSYTKNAVAVSGILEDANGAVQYLDAGNEREMNFPPGATWKSAASGVTYPDSWQIGDLEIGVTTHDQELFVRGRLPFVMSAIDVLGQSNDANRGHGFAELTGYGATGAL